MYVARRPDMTAVARARAHQAQLDLAATERAVYARGWRYINEVGQPSGWPSVAGAPIGFFKNSQGWIVLRGAPAYTLVPFFPGDPTPYIDYPTNPVFVLPAGYRPAATLWLRGGVTVEPSGAVSVGLQQTGYRVFQLDGVQFRTD